MKHLAVAAALPIGSQKPQPAFGKDKCVFARGTLKNVTVDSFSPMGIQESHKIQHRVFSPTNGAKLPYELL